MGGKLKKLILILLLLTILLSAGCFKTHVVAVTADRLYYDYRTNPTFAQEQYTDRTLQVTGVIASIGIAGQPYVLFYNSQNPEVCGVQCTFSKSYAPQLANLSVGQNITVIVKCKGYVGTAILLVAD
jgi:hypothetical protein